MQLLSYLLLLIVLNFNISLFYSTLLSMKSQQTYYYLSLKYIIVRIQLHMLMNLGYLYHYLRNLQKVRRNTTFYSSARQNKISISKFSIIYFLILLDLNISINKMKIIEIKVRDYKYRLLCNSEVLTNKNHQQKDHKQNNKEEVAYCKMILLVKFHYENQCHNNNIQKYIIVKNTNKLKNISIKV